MKDIFSLSKKFLARYKSSTLTFLLIVLVVSVISLLVPFVSGNFIDFLISNNSEPLLWRYCLAFAILSILGIFLGYFSNRIYIKTSTKISFDMTKDIVLHLQSLYITFIEKKNFAHLTQQIDADSKSITSFCFLFLQNAIVNTFKFIFPIIIIAFYNIKVFSILFSLTILYILIYGLFKKPLYDNSLNLKNTQSKYFGRLYEQLLLARFSKIQGLRNFFDRRVIQPYNNFLKAILKFQKIQYLFSGLDGLISTLAQISLFIIGGLSIIHGELTIGQFTVISTYFSMILGSIRYFFGLGKTIQEARASCNRIYEILKQKPMLNGSTILDSISSIKLNDISFSFGNNKIFSNFTYSFDKGKIYAIVGKNGVGKSTLLNLLLGLYPYEGIISYNNIDINSIDMTHTRRERVGVSEQQAQLLDGPLSENFNLCGDFNERKLQYLIDILDLNRFMSSLKKGLDSIIDNTNNLSGGEKEKISLIRALLKETEVLILDEPTTGLDRNSQKNILDYLIAIKESHIIIVVTHDEQIISQSDKVINLDDFN